MSIPTIIIPTKNQNSEQQVTTKNFLSPIGYRFSVKKLPYTNFFCQKANIPGVSIPVMDVPTPFDNIPFAGNHLSWDELVISFRVDENLTNYQEIFNWIKGESVFSFYDYEQIALQQKTSGQGLKSDFSLIIETSKKNANFNVIFKDGFPISLSGLMFNIQDEQVDFLEATAVFRYVEYKIEPVT